MGKIIAICISKEKGTVKTDIRECEIIKDHGLKDDAHAGSARQVSLLSYDEVLRFKEQTGGKVDLPHGIFGENLLVEGFDFKSFPVGTRFICNDVILELTQIGKKCHTGCEISKIAGKCIMPTEGVFARVIKGGIIRTGDEMTVCSVDNNDRLRASVLTASDRSFKGEREDKSGPLISEILKSKGYEVVSYDLLSDDEDLISERLKTICDELSPDVIFTTGGTGLSPRDHMPEATKKIADKDVPGISEAIRYHSLKITPNAMLSRAVSVIRGKTLIINLPGSPKAVSECLEIVLPPLDHGLRILRGEADG